VPAVARANEGIANERFRRRRLQLADLVDRLNSCGMADFDLLKAAEQLAVEFDAAGWTRT
jgi:hypothetical protein